MAFAFGQERHGIVTHYRLLLLLAAAIVLVAGCSGGGSTDASGSDISIDFPHVDGANRIDAAHLEPDQLSFAGKDAVASLHVVDERAMAVDSYYTVGIADTGWSLVDGKASEYIRSVTLAKDDRLAVITMVPGAVMHQFPEEVEALDFAPFEVGADDVDSGQTLLYSRIATCMENEITDCVLKIQQKIDAEISFP